MNFLPLRIAAVFLIAFYFATSPFYTLAQGYPRPSDWAQPYIADGVSNLYKVNDNLFRSAQPEEVGMQHLEKMGIKTVINLRSSHSDHEILKGTKLKYYEIPMVATKIDTDQVMQFLKIVSDTSNHPALLHCRRGADRTGALIAAYRVVYDGWTKDAAIHEMTLGGYGFNSDFKNLIELIQRLDVNQIRQQIKK